MSKCQMVGNFMQRLKYNNFMLSFAIYGPISHKGTLDI